MRTRLRTFLLAILVAAIPANAQADEREDIYFSDIAGYFQDSTSVLQEIVTEEIDLEDVPVIFRVSQETGASPQQITQLRLQGDSWTDIMRTRGMTPGTLYFVVAADFDSKTYTPLFAKYDAPQAEWSAIALTDDDVVNLVNLRFIYRRHGYSIFEVMAMRDLGKGFPAINQQIATLKHEQMLEEKEKKKKAAAASD